MMKLKIAQVYSKIEKHLKVTPLVRSESLDTATGCQLLFKLENKQITGSFKLRGALSKFSGLAPQGLNTNKVVAASTGNHALAVCHAAKVFGAEPIIFVPESIAASKFEKLDRQGVEIHRRGTQSGETEQVAIKYAHDKGIPLIHPYNDDAVIAGQGTIGLELMQQADGIDQVFVPVGGGGLISGIASYIKSVDPDVKIVGVQPINACEMADSVALGRIVEASKLQTISDGTAGGLDPNTITYKYCKDFVDEFVKVEENEIVEALQLMDKHLGIKVEPAAGLALAGVIKSGASVSGKKVAVIVCGGNIDQNSFQQLMREFV
jgi:threonine dehydratase